MGRSVELTDKLKLCDPDIQLYTSALEIKIAQLYEKIAKLEVANLSAKHLNTALLKQLKEHITHHPAHLTDEELERRLNELKNTKAT